MRLYIFALVILISSCSKQATVIDLENVFVDKYSGTYYVTNSHDKWETKDTSGSTISVVNNYVSTDTIVITNLDNSGRYSIEQLIMEGGHKIVEGTVINDSLKVNEDWSTMVRSVTLIGNITLNNDSIFLSYRWNNFDTWSQDVLPNYGIVLAQGIIKAK